MAGVTLLKPELQKLGATVLSQVCKTDSLWQRRCLAQEAMRPPLPACPPPAWGIGLLVKVTDLFIFPGPSALVLSVNSVCQSPWSGPGGRGRKAHPAPSQGVTTKHQGQLLAQEGNPSWIQISKLRIKSSIAQENWLIRHAWEVS